MNKEQVLGTIRHTLTFIGGILVTKGYVDETTIEAITGGIITLVGLVWSTIIKNKNDKNI
jgi:hypothetical protein